MSNLIGKYVETYDGHCGVVIKHFKPTGRSMTVHIKEIDGRVWSCPDNEIFYIGYKKRTEKKIKRKTEGEMMSDKEKIKFVIKYMKGCIDDAKKLPTKYEYEILKECFEYPLQILEQGVE